jgi:hypothetical protein
MEKLDWWCRDAWIVFIFALGTCAAVWLALGWDALPLGAKGSLLAAIIMPLHVVEEWKWPAGLHYAYNAIIFPKLQPDPGQLDRFPMSRLTDMFTNVGLVVVPMVYAGISVALPFLSTMLALCMVFFCFGELFAHTLVGIVSWRRYRPAGNRAIYSPGLGTSLLLFTPAGLYLCMHLPALVGSDWIGAVAAFVIMFLLCIVLAEFPLRRWVTRQEPGMFAFPRPQYYARFVDLDAYPQKEVVLNKKG